MKARIDECDGGETRGYRFERVAIRRKNEIVKKIKLLGNCSNKSSYEYYEYQILDIFKEIQKELRITRGLFASAKPTPDYILHSKTKGKIPKRQPEFYFPSQEKVKAEEANK